MSPSENEDEDEDKDEEDEDEDKVAASASSSLWDSTLNKKAAKKIILRTGNFYSKELLLDLFTAICCE